MTEYVVANTGTEDGIVHTVWLAPWKRQVAGPLPYVEACFLAERLNREFERTAHETAHNPPESTT